MIDKKLKEISLVILAVLFAILFLMVSQLLAQELNNDKLENLGVYRFDARGVSEVISLAITDRIRFEIQNRGQYSVIERDKMNLILKEQAFQQSGACLEASCLVEVGKLLAVTKMLGGSVSKIGNLFTLEVRVIDIESGQILKNALEDYSGPVEILLTKITRSVVDQLFGEKRQDNILFTGNSDLRISSDPTDGLIFIDDTPIGSLTPHTIQRLSSGMHVVRVEKGDLVAEEQINLIKDEFKRIELKLVKRSFRLKVFSEPEGAYVILAGSVIGKTPLDYKLPPTVKDSVVIEINAYRYEIERVVIPIEKNSILRHNTVLKPGGVLQIKDVRKNGIKGEVFLNGNRVATTPYININLPLGKYNVRVTGSQYDEDFIKDISVTLEQRYFDIKPIFERKRNIVNVLTNPPNSIVYLDGFFQGRSPVEIKNVEWGNHEIKVKRRGYHTYNKRLNLKQNDPLTINASLKPLSKGKAVMLSLILPGTGQYYAGGKKKGVFLTLLNSGLVGGAVYSRLFLYQTARDKYLDDRLAYDQSTTVEELERTRSAMQKSFDDADFKKNLSDGLSVGAAVIYLYTFFDTFRSFPSIRMDKFSNTDVRKVKFDSAIKGDGVSFNVQYTF